jgi:NAD+ diphosphatase
MDGEMEFRSAYDPGRSPAPGAGELYFVFQDNKLLHRPSGGSVELPAVLPEGCAWISYIGVLGGRPCFAADRPAEAPDDKARQMSDLAYGGQPEPGPRDELAADTLRALFGKLPRELMQAAYYAQHLVHWNRTSRHCGGCGSTNREKPDERAKLCPACAAVVYPRISPAVITAILRGKKILLARNKRFPLPIYSLIAGFVEPGETLEDCVRREVREEVGLEVDQVSYFGSQPWPFPDSLMLGFTARWAGSEIRLDDKELLDAGWFSPPEMPRLPFGDSISRRIINWYLEEYFPAP